MRKSRPALVALLVAPLGSVKVIDHFSVSPTPSCCTALCAALLSGALLSEVKKSQLRREPVPMTLANFPGETVKLPPSLELTPTYIGESVGRFTLVRSPSVNE